MKIEVDFEGKLTDTMMGIYPSYYEVDGENMLKHDYDLNDLARMRLMPFLILIKKEIDRNELVKVFYRLLNTRAKMAKLFIDNMAGKGYFTRFMVIINLCVL